MHRIKRLLVIALKAQLLGQRVMPPEAGMLIWASFLALNRARSWHQHGPNPISHQEIVAWCDLHRTPFEPRHIDVLRAMDDAWMAHIQGELRSKIGGEHAAPAGMKVLPPSSQQGLTPDLFDAMFG